MLAKLAILDQQRATSPASLLPDPSRLESASSTSIIVIHLLSVTSALRRPFSAETGRLPSSASYPAP